MKIGVCRCNCRRRQGQNARGPAARNGGSCIRSSRFCVLRILIFAAVLPWRLQTFAAENLPAQTIVVFNTAVPDAEALAKFYAEKRGIAADHLVELDCPTEEEISREQYDATIADPLRRIFDQRQWWHVHEASDGDKRVQTLAIHFIALIRGMPLKVGPPPTPHYSGRPDRIMPRSLFSMNSSSWLISSRGSISFRTASIAWRVFSFDR